MTDQGGQTPPGWYQAAGDPPGTQRYWDGTQWQGGPQPVGGAVPGGAQAAFSGAGAPAEYGPRFLAFLIDYAPIIALNIIGQFSSALSVIASLAVLGYWIYNYLYLMGTTGQTIGKKQQGITLLDDKTGQPVGMGMAFVRGLLGGVLAIICLLDYFWIFNGDKRQRLSDQILSYNVRKV